MHKAKRTTSRPTSSSTRGRGRSRRSQPGVAVDPLDTPATTNGANGSTGQREAEDTHLSNMTLDTLVTVIRGEIQRSAGTGSGVNPTPPDSGSIYNI